MKTTSSIIIELFYFTDKNIGVDGVYVAP
jgi:hypothetical protein